MDYFVVDVFSNTPLKGNPVAVFFVDNSLDTETMQSITTWVNLAETTFITRVDKKLASYDVRIFEPGGELSFAGHPSIGSAIAVKEYYGIDADKILQHCSAGPITITFENSISWLSAPEPKFNDIPPNVCRGITEILNIDVTLQAAACIEIGPIWLTALVEDANIVEDIVPDMGKIEKFSKSMGVSGINIAGKYAGRDDYKIRTFGPGNGGSPEDPACGSGNIALAKLLQYYRLNKSSYTAFQGQEIGRDAKILINYDEDGKIKIGGNSKILVRASLSL